MSIFADASLLRIFIGESDQFDNKPLYEAIVEKARAVQLNGATVLRGQMGYGRSTIRHAGTSFWVTQDYPVIVEIVDTMENLEAFICQSKKMTENCIMTLEKVNVLQKD
ncbi:DUF190 domain-containing protein [Ochrobactrum sp. BD22]